MSNTTLIKEQSLVLEKGIPFVPTPNKVDLGEIHSDVSQFLRRLLLKVYFHIDYNDNPVTQVSQSQNG